MLITVTPTSPGRFSASLDGRTLVAGSRTPFFAAARVLLAGGADPSVELAMIHAGRDPIAMRGRLGRLAGLAVREDADRGPRFAKHQPSEPGSPIAAAAVSPGWPAFLDPSVRLS